MRKGTQSSQTTFRDSLLRASARHIPMVLALNSLSTPPHTHTHTRTHSGLCIGSIACLAQQKTARLGNALGMVGVGTGIATALGSLSASPALYAQMLGTIHHHRFVKFTTDWSTTDWSTPSPQEALALVVPWV